MSPNRVSMSRYSIFALLLGACVRATASLPESHSEPESLASARQLVVVVTPSWDATSGWLRRYERAASAAQWFPVGAPTPVVIGRTGLAWGDSRLAARLDQPIKREGDGRSPAGLFPLDTAFGFAERELMLLRVPYVQLRDDSDCVDDVQSVHYNTVVDRSRVPSIDWSSAERMRQIPQYRLGVIVGYNAAPPARGRGSCIFLHIWGGPSSTTAGCTAMEAGDIESLMRWLERARRPVIVQLPDSEYQRLRGPWRLPSP